MYGNIQAKLKNQLKKSSLRKDTHKLPEKQLFARLEKVLTVESKSQLPGMSCILIGQALDSCELPLHETCLNPTVASMIISKHHVHCYLFLTFFPVCCLHVNTVTPCGKGHGYLLHWNLCISCNNYIYLKRKVAR